MTRKFSKILIYTGLFIILILGAFYLANLAGKSEFIRDLIHNFGYTGIFLVAIITGFNLVVPIPAFTLLPLFIESGFNFWPSILVVSLGLSVADAIGYFLGKIGREIIMNAWERKILGRLEKIKERYEYAPLAILFLTASFIPMPNELVVIPLAFLGYKLRLILPILFIGHLIFNFLYATGIINIFEIFSR